MTGSQLGGAAYVSFATEHDFAAFEEIVRGAVHRSRHGSAGRDALAAKLADPAFLDETAAKGGCWAIGFPSDDLGKVTARARTVRTPVRTLAAEKRE